MSTQLATSSVLEAYRQRTPASEQLFQKANGVFPGGLTHDARYLLPYPIYVQRAQASHKWDVDGNEYVDYFGGHGALLLGHNHPEVTEAVRDQLERGTHYGACHELEIRWGEIVQRLVPSAQRIRFTSSGTEATLMALRLARAYTGRTKTLRFRTHFHGWHDHVAFGVGSHHDGTPPPGVLSDLATNTVLCNPGKIDEVRTAFSENDDIAAVILEPTGATWGQVPLHESFLHDLREATAEHDIVLIFDEVVTGFRCSPGGAQGHYGVTPDLTTLAKILAGGFPGGAVVGQREIMDLLDHQAAADNNFEKITHHGTYNANPVSAAAGIKALEIVESTDACQRASDYAAELRDSFRSVLDEENVDWCVYGTFSSFHIFTNPDHESVSASDLESGSFDWRKIKQASASSVTKKLRLGMLAHGVDIMGWPGGSTSAVHTTEDIELTADALRRTLRLLKSDGDI